ncbi:MAG: DUF364 domain-containing protein [Arenicellales bacterium]
MSIIKEALALSHQMAEALSLPTVSHVYLPEQSGEPGFRDEFALIFLEDGTTSAFYASLPGALQALRSHGQAANYFKGLKLFDLVQGLVENDLARQAVAIGAFNAMSQYLMKQAGLLPELTAQRKVSTQPLSKGDCVGMVGYFCPLVDKLLAKGVDVLVLERQKERVLVREGVRLAQNASELAACHSVLCTASTLVNDSLDDLLNDISGTGVGVPEFSLIGPSGSGLVDHLFTRKITSVGGVYFPDQQALWGRLNQNESWGDAGLKYTLNRDNYPGISELLKRASI